MRAYKVTLVLLVAFLLSAPRPAHAWFGWLDDLSGPGWFNGAEFDFKVLCYMVDQPSPEKVVMDTTAAIVDIKSFIGKYKDDTNVRALLPPLEMAPLDLFGSAATKGVPTAGIASNYARVSMAISDLSEKFRVLTTPTPQSQQTSGVQPGGGAPLPQGVNPWKTAATEFEKIAEAWDAAYRSWRESMVPRISRPRAGFWASCSDPLRKEPPDVVMPESPFKVYRTLHKDRHPLWSIVLNYRDLANTRFLRFTSEVARDRQYADGAAIHLRIFETKIAWSIPKSVPKIPALLRQSLDFQHGLGIYQFSSAGFREGSESFSGLVVEPIRFDLHFPGSLVDKIDGENSLGNGLKRFVYSLSYSFGVLRFPGGLSADQFRGRSTGSAPDFPEHEWIREQGLVINVGRLLKL